MEGFGKIDRSSTANMRRGGEGVIVSHRGGLGSIPRPGVTCGLSVVLVLVLCSKGFLSEFLRFPSVAILKKFIKYKHLLFSHRKSVSL